MGHRFFGGFVHVFGRVSMVAGGAVRMGAAFLVFTFLVRCRRFGMLLSGFGMMFCCFAMVFRRGMLICHDGYSSLSV